jgi:DNA-binding NtrC family response regulator
MAPLILLIEVEERIFAKIENRFSLSDYNLVRYSLEQVTVEDITQASPDLVVIETSAIQFQNTISLAGRLRSKAPHIVIMLLCQHSTEERAITALRAGVSDYFGIPLTWPTFFKHMEKFIKDDHPIDPAEEQRAHPSIRAPQPVMIAVSGQMRETQSYISKVAASDSTVLITGETGTGKDLSARLIHLQSPRSAGPLVSVNCAALPESLAESVLFGHERGAFTGAVTHNRGKFAAAQAGTIFLDEIGDMHPMIQAKILHAIEYKVVNPLGSSRFTPINVRVIAATKQDPEQLVTEGHFREDLYYRLNVARIQLPPLRERKEDIDALIAHGLHQLNRRFDRNIKGLSGEAMDFIRQYHWPGNVRELMNLLEACYINMPNHTITRADFPVHFSRQLARLRSKPDSERRVILSALLETNWNKTRAARKLNWSRTTLYRKIANYKIPTGPLSAGSRISQ